MEITPASILSKSIHEALKTMPAHKVMQDFELSLILTDDEQERRNNLEQISFTLDTIDKITSENRAREEFPTALERYVQHARDAYWNNIYDLAVEEADSQEVIKYNTAFEIKNTKKLLPELYAQIDFVQAYLSRLASTGSEFKDYINLEQSVFLTAENHGKIEWINPHNTRYTTVNGINHCNKGQFREIVKNYFMSKAYNEHNSSKSHNITSQRF
ncbi:MAG: hypothetical protein ACLFTH_03415 [Candidatus Woesearchaeota archaeon]